jgi:hypothetical protein
MNSIKFEKSEVFTSLLKKVKIWFQVHYYIAHLHYIYMTYNVRYQCLAGLSPFQQENIS